MIYALINSCASAKVHWTALKINIIFISVQGFVSPLVMMWYDRKAIMLKLVHCQAGRSLWFLCPTGVQNSDGKQDLNWSIQLTEAGNFAVLDQNVRFSRKRYEIDPWYRGSITGSRRYMSRSMTLSDLERQVAIYELSLQQISSPMLVYCLTHRTQIFGTLVACLYAHIL